jgi:hypothetical protein
VEVANCSSVGVWILRLAGGLVVVCWLQGSSGQPLSAWSNLGPNSLNTGNPCAMSSSNTVTAAHCLGPPGSGSGGFPLTSSNGTTAAYGFNTISSGGTLPVPQQLSSNTSSTVSPPMSASAPGQFPASYPGMIGNVQMQPPGQLGPMSCPVPPGGERTPAINMQQAQPVS